MNDTQSIDQNLNQNLDQNLDRIVAEVQARYPVGPRYVHMYLKFWLESDWGKYKTLQDILAAPPPLPTWFEYAMTANARGRALSEQLSADIPKNARRYLDVGCGVGGFLVAFARRGLEVVGIESDSYRIQLAEANCLDHDLRNCVFSGNILNDGLADRFGRFDVITCSDVIEHVLDVPKTIHHMVELLEPGGVLMLAIPNKYSIRHVGRDPHFELFGITLLERPDAIQYHKAFFGFKYDVGDYYELDFYRRQIEALGCQFRLQNMITTDLPGSSLHYLRSNYRRYRNEHRPKLRAGLDRKIHWQAMRYLLMVARDRLLRVGSPVRREAFFSKFHANGWQVLATKPFIPPNRNTGYSTMASLQNNVPVRFNKLLGRMMALLVKIRNNLARGAHTQKLVSPDFDSELEFWDTELGMKGLYAEFMVYRTDPDQQNKIYPWEVQPYIKSLAEKIRRLPRVLDVGSGPVSMLAFGAHQAWFELISVDPLADKYRKMLRKYHFKQDLKLVKGYGEKLTRNFGPDSFDLVWMYNALDHSQSPQKVFAELVNVLRPGGYLIIQGQSREGTAAGWSGLHQHDLYVAAGGKLMCESGTGMDAMNLEPKCLSDGYALRLVESSEPSTEVHKWVRLVWQKYEHNA
jgi:2-polyprenyl-3-methyl-5-hydroxy-6-metoxy-1,4-benzoquinol methylase